MDKVLTNIMAIVIMMLTGTKRITHYEEDMMKKFIALFLALVLVLGMAACKGSDKKADPAPVKEATETKEPAKEEASGKVVGVSMPTKSLQRWNQDGSNMEADLKDHGYDVDLQYADNKVDVQVSQLENMITKGVDVLVVASIDGGALTSVLEEAQKEGIVVIAYDRLIMNTDAISYYATFDNYSVGTIQGEYIVDALDLTNEAGPFNFEIATGPLDDNNVNFFLGGAMDVLQPYIDEGKLVVQSGQTTWEQAATPNWDEAEAQTRMDNLLTAHYADKNVDAILCSNDSVSLGVQSALKSAGYGTADKAMPILTGQDANVANVKAIVAGEQSMSVFKDTRSLANQVVKMIDSIFAGETPETNDTETYDNGAKVVPSYLLKPEFVDINNYKALLVDTGYYSEDELK